MEMQISKVKVLKNNGLEIVYSEAKILPNNEEYIVSITEKSDIPCSQELKDTFHELIFFLRLICDQKDQSEIVCKQVIYKDDGFMLGGSKSLMGKMILNLMTPYISWDAMESFYGLDQSALIRALLNRIENLTNDYLRGEDETKSQLNFNYEQDNKDEHNEAPGSDPIGIDDAIVIPGQPGESDENEGESVSSGTPTSEEQDGHIASGEVSEDTKRPDYMDSGSTEDSEKMPGIFGG